MWDISIICQQNIIYLKYKYCNTKSASTKLKILNFRFYFIIKQEMVRLQAL